MTGGATLSAREQERESARARKRAVRPGLARPSVGERKWAARVGRLVGPSRERRGAAGPRW
jgi:hypothetical protein